MTANYPNLRLVSVPQVGTQEAQTDFNGRWESTTPEIAKNFSAVGYLFGRRLHLALGVPVGLIDNAWGGSACEAWIPRDRLNQLPVAKPYMDQWRETEKTFDYDKLLASYQEKLEAWKMKAEIARKDGKPQPGGRPRAPRNQLTGQHRPANLYNGVLNPIIGYGIKGAIWYQGESNCGSATYNCSQQAMVSAWRQAWHMDGMAFGFVELSGYAKKIIEAKLKGEAFPEHEHDVAAVMRLVYKLLRHAVVRNDFNQTYMVRYIPLIVNQLPGDVGAAACLGDMLGGCAAHVAAL